MAGAAATKRRQDLPLRQGHLIRLPPIHPIDPHLVLGSEKPANMTNRDHWPCIWPKLAADSHARERYCIPEEQVPRFDPAHGGCKAGMIAIQRGV